MSELIHVQPPVDLGAAVIALCKFIGSEQLQCMIENCDGEEGQFFKDKLIEFAQRVENMPKTYEQDGKGDQAVAYLHYFAGSCDWWITEKDKGDPSDPDPGAQHQAFGRVRMHGECELGYISIVELMANGVELDLHFTPCTLADLDTELEKQDKKEVAE